MYYEEAIINGVLHWRGTPNGAWIAKTKEELTKSLMEWRDMADSFLRPPLNFND